MSVAGSDSKGHENSNTPILDTMDGTPPPRYTIGAGSVAAMGSYPQAGPTHATDTGTSPGPLTYIFDLFFQGTNQGLQKLVPNLAQPGPIPIKIRTRTSPRRPTELLFVSQVWWRKHVP